MTCACGVPGCTPDSPDPTPVYVHRHGPTPEQLAETLAAAGLVTEEVREGLHYATVARQVDAEMLSALLTKRVPAQREPYEPRHARTDQEAS